MKGRPRDPTRTRRETGHRELPGQARLTVVPALPASVAEGGRQVTAVDEPIEPPDDLPIEAHEIWRAALAELAGRHLKTADLEALRQMAVAAARARQASASIAQYGLIVEGKRGPMVNPLVRVEKDATSTYLRIAEQYGLTLAARLRLGLMQLSGESMLSNLNAQLDDAQAVGQNTPARGGRAPAKKSTAKKSTKQRAPAKKSTAKKSTKRRR